MQNLHKNTKIFIRFFVQIITMLPPEQQCFLHFFPGWKALLQCCNLLQSTILKWHFGT